MQCLAGLPRGYSELDVFTWKGTVMPTSSHCDFCDGGEIYRFYKKEKLQTLRMESFSCEHCQPKRSYDSDRNMKQQPGEIEINQEEFLALSEKGWQET